MSYDVLRKIINYNLNKNNYTNRERLSIIAAYRKELKLKMTTAGNVLENIIDHLNND